MGKLECLTQRHIFIGNLDNRGEGAGVVGFREVLRDGTYGLLVWCAVAVAVGLGIAPQWSAVVGLGIFAAIISVTAIRLVAGHSAKCALLYGLHWPLHIAEYF
ncbi:hypothetical protein ACFWDI_05735 [Streptomyces sp. NPDC060064]|uniref:hypothetical protein n=1 Tax=Streptomyces sp. NPDC060064 TaxID=3347049 RepID=UPI0036A76E78